MLRMWRGCIGMLQGWREKVGPDFPLSLDCYMSLSVPYVQPIFGSVAIDG
jgi:hypothetical protein